MPNAKYFAMYLQSVSTETGGRYQSLVLPPIRREPGDEFSPYLEDKFVWWWRFQTLGKQRPKWQRYIETSGSMTPLTDLSRFQGPGWQLADPILVEVRRVNVALWLRSHDTPYPLINLLEKKAALQNIRIQGPTSIPQVVTPVPSS